MFTFADIFFLAGLVWGVLASVLIVLALIFARIHSFIKHKHLMLVMLGGGWSFVLFYLVGYVLGESYSESVEPRIALWLIAHGVIALATLLAVSVLIWARLTETTPTSDRVRARAYINSHHKLFGLITALLWLITQAGGFINFYILK